MPYLDTIDPGNSGGSVPAQSSPWEQLSPPEQVLYLCRFCDARFLDLGDFFLHRSSAHPFRRPALILDGRELTAPRVIAVQPLQSSHITLVHTTTCFFDGKKIPAERLPELLAGKREGMHSVILEKFGIKTAYEIVFEIADVNELREVDKVFSSLVCTDTLSLARINGFAEVTARYKTAIGYVDGLCQYLYGVLAKDQRGGTTLDQLQYKTKFNLAVSRLQDFRRPLADVVVGIVNFSQNIFTDGSGLDVAPKLRHAMRVFFGFEKGVWLAEEKLPVVSAMSSIPIDDATNQILNLASASSKEILKDKQHLEAVIASGNWGLGDKLKVSMLLAERLAFEGQIAAAQGLVRSIANDALFADWVIRIMKLDAKK